MIFLLLVVRNHLYLADYSLVESSTLTYSLMLIKSKATCVQREGIIVSDLV